MPYKSTISAVQPNGIHACYARKTHPGCLLLARNKQSSCIVQALSPDRQILVASGKMDRSIQRWGTNLNSRNMIEDIWMAHGWEVIETGLLASSRQLRGDGGRKMLYTNRQPKFFGRVAVYRMESLHYLDHLGQFNSSDYSGLMAPITLYGGNGAALFKGSQYAVVFLSSGYRLSQAAQFLAMIPPMSHQWQLSHSVNEQFETPESTNYGGSPEMTLGDKDFKDNHSHGIMESTYFDTSTAHALDNSDWQQSRWWTSLMESPLPQADQDDDFLSMALAPPNYTHFYRETGQSQPTPYSQASESGGFDWDAEIAAAELYYNQAGFFDAPAATSGGHFAHDPEMPQALGSSQRASHEMNSRLSTTCFDPPLRSNRYMPYPIPARFLQPPAIPIFTDQGDMSEGSSHSLMSTVPFSTLITLPQLVTVIPQAIPPPVVPQTLPLPVVPQVLPPPVAPQILPLPAIPPVVPPAPTDIIFGPEAVTWVQLLAWECMKTRIVEISFLMTSKASATLARQSLDQTVLTYNNRGSKVQAQVAIMANTVKNLRDSIKSLVRIHVVLAYELHKALTLQMQMEVGIIIQNLLQYHNFLYGEINSGGRTTCKGALWAPRSMGLHETPVIP
ncbi:hypothetical protein BDR06DRAFT_971154 [Suillus hirtellus]|nr:hypothetical protein BDR06DRAFT_971154 [Suillus hirtellus]